MASLYPSSKCHTIFSITSLRALGPGCYRRGRGLEEVPVRRFSACFDHALPMVGRFMAHSVLIIEDEREFAEFIISGLTEEGFSVAHALNGSQGYAMLNGHSWDLVLLDWSLPGTDGLTLLRGYRQSGGDAPVSS